MRLIDADAFDERIRAAGGMVEEELSEDFKDGILTTLEMLKRQPTIEPERDIPKAPNSTEDHAWGKKGIVPVCPNCDTYLTEVYFLEEGKKVTYCDHCGQAINWEGWEYD